MASLEGLPFAAVVTTSADEAVVAVSGEVDVATADDFWTTIETVASERQHVVLDLTDTSFMDSSGLTVLVRAHRHVAAVDGSLSIRTAPGTVRKVLSVSGLSRSLNVDRSDDQLPATG